MTQPEAQTLLRGINMFKELVTEDNMLNFKGVDGEVFGINLSSIKNSNLYGRHEVELNIPLEDFNDANDILCDIRFYIPEGLPDGETGGEGDGEEEENEEEGEEEEDENEDGDKPADKKKAAAKPAKK
jgi:Structure-specific recognition protein (SSRP1)